MARLYFRFYIALLASLLLFALAVATLWHRAGGPMERGDNALAILVRNALPPAAAPAAEQQAALERLARGLGADITLFDAGWTPLAAVGRPMPRPERHMLELVRPPHHFHLRLDDGRHLVSTAPIGIGRHRYMLHAILLSLALIIAVGAYPVVRRLTRRLERLQRGVESLGAGDLSARVPVEGADEVARLAASFNRAADQIEQLVGAHRALLANASHELRTPLARIRLALELVKDNVDAKRKAGLEQDIAELDQLIDEILLASRLDAVREQPDSEEIDLLALAAEECARYEEAELEGESLTVRGEERLLRRLLRNLLDNARRHGAAPFQVRLRRHGDTAELSVCDAGPGVPPEEYDKVFEPFHRLSNARERGGAGLGLALVRQIARRHGGEARCGAIDGKRSGFIVTLPLSA
ncbi:MAG: ATP-binding protein [Pseudomonadota bacterium]